MNRIDHIQGTSQFVLHINLRTSDIYRLAYQLEFQTRTITLGYMKYKADTYDVLKIVRDPVNSLITYCK